MRKIEKYHYEEVKEIERIFEKKLKQEGDGYLQLEQEGLEMKQRYEKQIDQIKRENKEAIDGLLNEFKTNLRKVHYEYKESEESDNKDNTCTNLLELIYRSMVNSSVYIVIDTSANKELMGRNWRIIDKVNKETSTKEISKSI